MKKVFVLTVFLISAFCGNALAQDACYGISCMPKGLEDRCTNVNQQYFGCVDWTSGVVYAVGLGVPNPNFKSQAQRNYGAIVAAKTVALRNLLMMVKSINISSAQTVENGMLMNETIRTHIQGKIQQALMASNPRFMSDGSVWVTMKMYMKNIRNVMMGNELTGHAPQPLAAPQQQQSPYSAPVPVPAPAPAAAPAPAQPKPPAERSPYGGDTSTVYSGLIIDARGTDVMPAMSPKVVDDKGMEIYGSAYVDRNFALQQGMAGYIKDLNEAKTNERVAGNPLVLKALRSQGAKGSDLVLSAADADLLRKLNSSQAFMRECRVMIVID